MSKDVHYYMSKGMERKVAEYFASGIKKIISVNPNKDYTLTLSYDDGSIRLYDCKPFLLKDTVFEPFMEWDNFRRVYFSSNGSKVCWDVDPEVDSNEVWDNVVDLCADAVYIDSIPYEGGSNG
ncbi:Hypothetical protein SFBmNL_00400 [Candidatus Arthromitus sp. SFB-mouse-NL]|uniref:DUF2442 domain-containing protein n=1 Tax=Candidatus Arthromitus sp. SFB-mouse-NL TaxID=1508644 RepID=UPI00049B354C|nr:DUF2442 domain-containing protein [Candidatus Arthromitus sp. SFB-mouse-NL]AID44318.1 Hypothetical protein SFBmNL_00400 [Candidatus Arthromitus sp. SFB-mouse-NL]